jgi:hypothetical protein
MTIFAFLITLFFPDWPATAAVCSTEGATHVYVDIDGECESGHNHACWARVYLDNATVTVCCDDVGECTAQLGGSTCETGTWHTCDI